MWDHMGPRGVPGLVLDKARCGLKKDHKIDHSAQFGLKKDHKIDHSGLKKDHKIDHSAQFGLKKRPQN